MKKVKVPLLLVLFLVLTSCSAKITEENLVGGYWEVTAGYIDGKPKGEPDCLDFISGGLEFKDENIVHGKEFDEDFEYQLEERKKGAAIEFIRKDIHYAYYIEKISVDEIGLTGVEGFQEDQSCYSERQ